MNRRTIAFLFLLIFVGCSTCAFAQTSGYPNYAYEFLGKDKHENYNRKMFNFDRGLNKYFIRPVHVIWATILPQYAMDRIYGVSNNLEYPIRCVSSLVQRDFHNAGNETKRFLINTTIGLGGMFDPAKHMLKIYRSRDNMDKALSRLNIKPGTYFVAPVIAFTSPRDICGRVLDMALNPSTYIGTPILAAVKAGIMINRTSYLQTLISLVESSYADPYEITKTAYGIDKYIKKNNLDRVQVVSMMKSEDVAPQLEVSAKILSSDKSDSNDSIKNLEAKLGVSNVPIKPDMKLANYCPQSPVVDSMRTFLFDIPEVRKSIWNEMSPWNRSFSKKIKTVDINLSENRTKYTFRYILQKNKNAPLVVVYPSTGDGVYANHPMMFAKIFYDCGYSVIIQGNPFQWEFVKSMPADYRPGLPSRDALAMRKATRCVIDKLEEKYKCEFKNKVLFGTSLAALDILYIANEESKTNTLGNTQYIAVCPPIDLMYALRQVDGFAGEWVKFPDDLKQKVAFASAKLVNLYQSKQDIDFEVNKLPFDEDEARLITGFIMHQKLSDIIFTIENAPANKSSDIYSKIQKMGFEDYFNKYMMENPDAVAKEVKSGFGLIVLSNYLKTGKNYKIYHTLNDYLITKTQLKQLKKVTGNNLVILDNGSHMGFTYRPEFQNELKTTITGLKANFN